MKNNNDAILKDFLCDIGEEDIWIADGWADAFIGLACVHGTNVAVYSTGIIVIELMEGGMTYDEAEEYLQFNVIGADIGANTPVFVDLIPDEYWRDGCKDN